MIEFNKEDLNLSVGIDLFSPIAFRHALKYNLNFVDQLRWFTKGKDLKKMKIPKGWKVSYFGGYLIGLTNEETNEHMHLQIGQMGDVHASLYSTSFDKLKELEKIAKKLAIPYDVKAVKLDEDSVSITFWAHTKDGPLEYPRKIEAPKWSTLQENYTQLTHQCLDDLIKKDFTSREAGGKLVVWTGVPGTGKTFALRALAREWKEWAAFHYIIDPEAFFAGSASYMLQLLMYQAGNYKPKGSEKFEEKWKVLIFEDTGEVLTKDAKRNTGQGLSRLLNICDGLIGQGLKVLIIITSNEDIELLHEAVTRPGRCLANVIFNPLTREEILNWAEKYKVAAPKGVTTLAGLYAIKNKETVRQTNDKRIGFAPAEKPKKDGTEVDDPTSSLVASLGLEEEMQDLFEGE